MISQHAIVLTGGIATGKSTVSSMLLSHGFEVIDADKIAREILPLHVKKVEALFGQGVVHDGLIDRKALGALIFGNRAKRQALNDLLHPLIREEIYRLCEGLEKQNRPYIIDIPLYFESKGYPCSMVAVVYAPKALQYERLMKRDSLSQEEASHRINAQIDIEKKKEMADFVIDNTQDQRHLAGEVEKFIRYIRGKYADCKI